MLITIDKNGTITILLNSSDLLDAQIQKKLLETPNCWYGSKQKNTKIMYIGENLKFKLNRSSHSSRRYIQLDSSYTLYEKYNIIKILFDDYIIKPSKNITIIIDSSRFANLIEYIIGFNLAYKIIIGNKSSILIDMRKLTNLKEVEIRGRYINQTYMLPEKLELLQIKSIYTEPIFLPKKLNKLFLISGNKKINFLTNSIDSVELKSIQFSESYDHDMSNLPTTLEEIKFGRHFNQDVSNLPIGVKNIYFGDFFCHPLDYLPNSVVKLSFMNKCNVSLDNLPNSVELLDLSSCNHIFNFEQLPDSITSIITNPKSLRNISNIKKIPINLKFILVSFCAKQEQLYTIYLDGYSQEKKISIILQEKNKYDFTMNKTNRK
jgi:hypothetical protein